MDNMKNDNEILAYKIGDIVKSGEKIKGIYKRTNWYIIFFTEISALSWEFSKSRKWTMAIEAETATISSEIKVYVPRHMWGDAYSILASAFSKALDLDSWFALLCFRKIKKYVKSYRKYILGTFIKNKVIILYKTKNGNIPYWYNEKECDWLGAALAEFQRLISLSASILCKTHRRLVAPRLAAALGGAYYNKGDMSGFREVEEFIMYRSERRAKYWFYTCNIIMLIPIILALISMIYFGVNENWWAEYLAGIFGGLIGAIISTLQRVSDLKMDPLEPLKNMIALAVSRLILGAVFGFFLISLVKAQIALGNLNGNIFGIIVFSIVAGFSERAIPNYMETLSKSIGNN